MQQAPPLLELIQTLHQQMPSWSFGLFSGNGDWELALGRYSIWNHDSSEEILCRLRQEIHEHLDFAVLGRNNETEPSGFPLSASMQGAVVSSSLNGRPVFIIRRETPSKGLVDSLSSYGIYLAKKATRRQVGQYQMATLKVCAKRSQAFRNLGNIGA